MGLDVPRRAVLTDMAYQLGGVGLAKFARFLVAVRAAEWDKAGSELKGSLLSRQVPKRVLENWLILTTGQFPPGVASAAELIRRHEGCVLKAQPDTNGMWEIGYGHDIPAPRVDESILVCSQDQAESWFEEDLARAEVRAEVDLGPEYW